MTDLLELDDKKTPGLRWSYPWLHWSITLLATPLFESIFNLLFHPKTHHLFSLIEVYPIVVPFSIVFSVPALLIYLLVFYFLRHSSIDWKLSKSIMIGLTLFVIFLTMRIMGGSAANEFFLSYAGSALLIDLLLKIKAKENL